MSVDIAAQAARAVKLIRVGSRRQPVGITVLRLVLEAVVWMVLLVLTSVSIVI